MLILGMKMSLTSVAVRLLGSLSHSPLIRGLRLASPSSHLMLLAVLRPHLPILHPSLTRCADSSEQKQVLVLTGSLHLTEDSVRPGLS